MTYIAASLNIFGDWKSAWLHKRVYAGPYYDKPIGTLGVCLLEDAPRLAVDEEPSLLSHLPIPDYSIPRDDKAVTESLKDALRAMLAGHDVYVGCMGGKGRTGLYLALLCKVLECGAVTRDNWNNPYWDYVAYVRANYNPHACETTQQMTYVGNFNVKPLQRWLAWQVVKSFFTKSERL